MKKLYVVVRGDLPEGAQIAQSCHAVSAFAADFPASHADWHRHGQNLVVLQIPNEAALTALLEFALTSDAIDRVSPFREPDFGHQLTACAFDDGISRAVSSLPLALRKKRCDGCRKAINGTDCSDCRSRVVQEIDAANCEACA